MPKRLLSILPRARSSLFWSGVALALVQCQLAPTQTRPHDSLTALWHDFEKLPLTRALALAGNPDLAWVAGMAGGAANQQDAIDVALESCRQKRQERRMRDPCLLYAVDDEIVWTAR